jgi:general L-amino acid transport system permease protein
MSAVLTSLWTNKTYRSLIIQVGAVLILFGFVAILVANTASNLEKRGITSGFGFLNQPAGFDIVQTLVPYEMSMSHGRVLLVGILNTLLVSVLGIVTATFIGVSVGISRLSDNWLIARLAGTYVEILRNIPLLLQIYFWYGMTLLWPKVRQSIDIGGVAFINNRGVELPRLVLEEGAGFVGLAFLILIIAGFVFRRWAKGEERKGTLKLPRHWIFFALVLGVPLLVAALMGFPWTFDVPVRGRFNFQGGTTVLPSLIALWFALSTYTAAFIAETVRSGIQAVSRGQREAAASLGLKPSLTMRLVILPQALRVIIPQLISQYLNLTKNSSLAVAVGYPEIMGIFAGTSLSQTGQAVEIILITMMFYLTVSLIVSAVMNVYNRRVALRGGIAR